MLIVIFQSFFCFCADAQITFQKTYGGPNWDEFAMSRQTSDGGFIAIGNTTSFIPVGKIFIYLIKTDVNGDTLWTRTFSSGTLCCQYGFDVKQTFDGGYILSGEIYPNPFLIKTDASGNPVWCKSYTGSISTFSMVEQTADSGYILLGVPQGGGWAIYLVKTNAAGDTTWTRNYAGYGGIGGLDSRGACLTKTFDGGYIFGGNTDAFSPNINNSYYHHLYIVRTDINGDTLWTKVYGDINSTGQENARYIIQTSDSGFMIAGDPNFLLKINSNGDYVWAKKYYPTSFNMIQQTRDGGFVGVGTVNSPT